MNKILLSLCCFLMIGALRAQIMPGDVYSKNNEARAILVNLNFAHQLPAGDLADRFENNNSLGCGVDLIMKNSNLIFGLNGFFMFGNRVKEDVIASLRDPFGGILGSNFTYADVVLRERGLYGGAHVGKLFGLSKNNKRMGIRATFGVGYLMHKVRIQDNGNSAVQIFGDYVKLYDHQTVGLALNQFVGFQLLAKNRLLNFYAGAEFTEAFTKNSRSFNVDSMGAEEDSRMDILYGFRVGWTVPFYIGEAADEIYY